MGNIKIGFVCLVFAIFIYFFSYKEKKNVLGYKSLQLNTHTNIWFWTNKCFGFLTIIGSILYLLVSIILFLSKKEEYLVTINKFGAFYLLFSFIITELYAFIKKTLDKKGIT